MLINILNPIAAIAELHNRGYDFSYEVAGDRNSAPSLVRRLR